MEIKDYFIKNTRDYYNNHSTNREKFLKKNNFIFEEISKSLKNLINDSKKIISFCCGNSIVNNFIHSDEVIVNEITASFFESHRHKNSRVFNGNFDQEVKLADHIVIADIEHQKNTVQNLLTINKNLNDDARVIVISKSLIWIYLINFYKAFINIGPKDVSFLPFSNLKNLFLNCNFDIVKNEKLIFIPFKIPFFTSLINKIFRLPILNSLCLINLTVLKKKQKFNNLNSKISFIIPCKNEEKNIPFFEEEIKNCKYNAEFIFGDDNSSDKTLVAIQDIKKKLSKKEIKIYSGLGICKSDNVYKGIDYSNGDIIVIYDADLTVSFNDIESSLNLLLNTNADFINCSRMIIPQNKNAMKKFNFFGNLFFAYMFSLLFKNKISDTLCGTKIFYKKDWTKIKKYNSSWGAKDLWGDFDLLIGAYKNNLKIVEIPVTYLERLQEDTKMKNVLSNAYRMFKIVIGAYYKLRIKD